MSSLGYSRVRAYLAVLKQDRAVVTAGSASVLLYTEVEVAACTLL